MTEFYRKMIAITLNAILNRFEADKSYPFIDTKLDLSTGANFEDSVDATLSFRKKKYIYSWIQGRGLEAMAAHAEFMPEFAPRILPLLNTVSEAMESLRKKAGRVWFIMSEKGEALKVENFNTIAPMITIPPGSSYSDLFYSKGLFAAATAMHNKKLEELAANSFRNVLEDILSGAFVTDQQTFDPANLVTHNPDRIIQGPKMIALGGLANFMSSGNRTFDWPDYARIFIEFILDHHVCRNNGLVEYGFMEAVTKELKPYKMNGQTVLGDPGHAGEFVGLASKCLALPEFLRRYPELSARMKVELPLILSENFKLGFNRNAAGICKSVNLRNGEPVNSDMPWWNLPETMRAAAFVRNYEILTLCDNAFRNFFINEKVHMMAYQNRNSSGEVISIIPATPDADPGYHTNLSMIDVLKILGK